MMLLLLGLAMASSDIVTPADPSQATAHNVPEVITTGAGEGMLELRYRAPLSEISYRAQPSYYSQGCGKTQQAGVDTLRVEGLERNFISYIPENYRNDHAYQLILAFHGRTGSNAEVQEYFALEPFAENSIIVYPSGLDDPKVAGARTWSDAGDSGDALRDYAFFDALVAYFSQHYCLNSQRIFAVGHSLGASFVNSLACARADTLAGVASLAGGVYSSRSIEAGCSQSVAMLLMHNPHDEHVPFAMGEQVLELYLEQHQTSTNAPEAVANTLLKDLQCHNYASDAPLIWCPHQQDYGWNGRYYPHGWMAGMGEAVMTFFAEVP